MDVKELCRLAVALGAIGAVSVLCYLDKVDMSLVSAVIFTVLGYYFGRHESAIMRKLRGE